MTAAATWFDRSALTWHEQYGTDDTGDVRYAGHLVRWRCRPKLRPIAASHDDMPSILHRERFTSMTDLAAPVPADCTEPGAHHDGSTWEGLDTRWMDAGLCRQPAWRNAGIAFPPVREGEEARYVRPDWLAKSNTLAGRAAIQVCSACPVAADCLAYALDGRLLAGTWGGVSADERASILAAASAPARTLTAAH